MGCVQSNEVVEEGSRSIHPTVEQTTASSHVQSIHFNLNQSNNGSSFNQSNDGESLLNKITYVNAQREKAEEQLRNTKSKNASSHQQPNPAHKIATPSNQAAAEIERAKQDLARAQILSQQSRINQSTPIQLRPVPPTGLRIDSANHAQTVTQSSNHDHSPTSQAFYSQSISLGPIKNKDSLLYNSGLSPIVKNRRSPPISPGRLTQSSGTSMRWEITDQLLGKGRFASVFLGYDREHDQLIAQSLNQPNQPVSHSGNQSSNRKAVAIKVIDKREFHRNRTMVDTELAILRKMGHHEHIVCLIDCFEDALHFYFVMEFASGGDLFSAIIDRGRFTETDASRACQQIALALQYIHSCGIAHRDLKPENVLLVSNNQSNNQIVPTDDLHLKLADFGLSKLMANTDTVMATVCGTWAYCAPEVIKHQAYTQSVDQWTLGVLMYILLCGYHPFDAYGDLPEPELLAKICDCEYDFDDPAWSSVSREAKQLINQLLQVDPTKRLGLDQFLASDWISNANRSINQSSAVDPTLMPKRLKQTLGQAFKAIVHAKVAVTRFRASISRSRNNVESRSKANLSTHAINQSIDHSPNPSHNSLHYNAASPINASRKASIVSTVPVARISPQETFIGDDDLEVIDAV